MATPTYGSRRERIDADALRKLKEAGAVHLDPRRSRPLWFDGRFLKAADLNREQNYFLTRQGDLALAAGTGVIEGLEVTAGPGATSLVIRRGHGVTSTGERVVLDADRTVDLADVPLIQRLNAALGLSREPAPPLRARTGLFVVALRPLEYTANPVASYPTHVDDARTVEDGEIIEATAVTLIPYAPGPAVADPALRRADAAHRIFVGGGEGLAPTASLPLALVELERGRVRWVDPHLVRREAGTARRDVLGLGLVSQPLREAHLRQYHAMLDDLVAQRQRLHAGLRFAAAEHFLALPPAGRMPAAAVDAATSTQYFFPAAVDVELSVVPADEIPLLVEESLLLPPIDLTASEAELAATSVLVLVPVERHRLATVARTLERSPPVLRPAGPAPRAHLMPVDAVRALRAKLPRFGTPVPAPGREIAEGDWREEVARHRFLWFVRRRNLSYKEEIVGEAVRVLADDAAEEAAARERLKALKADARFERIAERQTPAAAVAVSRLLTSPALLESKVLALGAVAELERKETVNERAAREVVERYGARGVGEGIQRLEAELMEKETRADGSVIKAAFERNRTRAERLAATGRVPQLDALARRLPPDELRAFAEELRGALAKPNLPPEALGEIIEARAGGGAP
ncbi:MAG: hypothetical protein Kow0092_31280 [Deferrisomatales bacterium]